MKLKTMYMKNKIMNLPINILLFLFLFQVPEISLGQENFPWPEGKKFAISLSFDDSRKSNLDYGIPILNQYGVKGTFYVHPQVVKENLKEWKDAILKGHEIGNHTLVHPCSENFIWSRNKSLEEYSLESMREELEQASQQIYELLGVKPISFAFTCGQTYVGRGAGKRSYAPLIADLFVSGRGWLNEAPADPYYLDLAEVNGMKMDDIDFEDILPVINYAREKNLWLVLVGHDTKPDNSEQTTRLKFLEDMGKYINEHSDIWSATVGEIASYVQTTRTNGRKINHEPLPIQSDADGNFVLKASLGKGDGPKIEYMPEWKAYGWWTSRDSVVWNIDVRKSGKYLIELEWSISDEEAGKPMVFQIGEKQIIKTIHSSGSWETFKKIQLGILDITKGKHKVIVKPKDQNAKGHFMDLKTLNLIRQ